MQKLHCRLFKLLGSGQPTPKPKPRYKHGTGKHPNQGAKKFDNVATEAQLKELGILNLSTKFKISRHQAAALAKGLTFVPTPTHTPISQLHEGVDRLTRAVKIKNSYLKFKGGNDKFKIPSNYMPAPGTYPPEIEELGILLKQEIRKFDEKNLDPPNLTKVEKKAFVELKNNKDIVIKPGDKGSAIVIMDRSDYALEANRQLAVSRHYTTIEEPQFPKNCEIFNRILTEMRAQGLISAKEFAYLKARPDSRERIFYLLPKIHKEMEKWTIPGRVPPGRPIVSDVASESYNIARFIDYHLAPFSCSHRAYVKNTYDFLHKLSKVKANDNSLLISLDVDSLYTNIDNEMGLRAVAEVFEQKPLPIHKYILQLLRLSLEGNDFTFDGNSYLQVSGTAMGKRFAPNYANLTMAYWEEKNLPKCDKQPSIYLRYLDDIFLIWDHSVEDFDKFFHTLNTAHPNIRVRVRVRVRVSQG